MTELRDPLSRAETGDLGRFSKLEASLIETVVEQRPNSRAQNNINRHAEKSDLNVNELDFDFEIGENDYPLDDLRSLQQVFDTVQCHHHLRKRENFSLETNLECLSVDWRGAGEMNPRPFGLENYLSYLEWQTLTGQELGEFLQVTSCHPMPIYFRI